MKKLLMLLFCASICVMAQTQNDTFTMQGFGCDPTYPQGCVISPNDENSAPWVAQQQEYPPSNPVYYPSTVDQSVTTGLNIPLTSHSKTGFPQHATGTGSGTFNWFSGGGPQGSFTVTLSCTWDLQSISGISAFTESCVSPTDPSGQSVQFTRHWYITEGRFGIWSLHELKVPSAGIVPIMILVASVPD